MQRFQKKKYLALHTFEALFSNWTEIFIYIHTYFVNDISLCSGETARMRMLILVFAAYGCDKNMY